MTSSFIGGENGENHRLVASHWQTLSHNIVSSTPHMSGCVRTHNISGDRHWLHTVTTVPYIASLFQWYYYCFREKIVNCFKWGVWNSVIVIRIASVNELEIWNIEQEKKSSIYNRALFSIFHSALTNEITFNGRFISFNLWRSLCSSP